MSITRGHSGKQLSIEEENSPGAKTNHAGTLTLDLQPPELQNKFLLCKSSSLWDLLWQLKLINIFIVTICFVKNVISYWTNIFTSENKEGISEERYLLCSHESLGC